MPTRYYLVGADLVRHVSRLEAAGGVREAEATIDAELIAETHARYAAERGRGDRCRPRRPTSIRRRSAAPAPG